MQTLSINTVNDPLAALPSFVIAYEGFVYEGAFMSSANNNSSVHNSRPFDVHRWSEHPEVESFVAPLWNRFEGEQADVIVVKKGRPTKRIKRDNMKVLLLDFYVCWCEDPTRYIGISSNRNDWSKGRYKAIHLSKTILDVLNWLVAEGLVDKRDHFHSQTPV